MCPSLDANFKCYEGDNIPFLDPNIRDSSKNESGEVMSSIEKDGVNILKFCFCSIPLR